MPPSRTTFYRNNLLLPLLLAAIVFIAFDLTARGSKTSRYGARPVMAAAGRGAMPPAGLLCWRYISWPCATAGRMRASCWWQFC